ncbi:MAG TPA: Calx-beta domain-containing protein [Thermoanaerobaculia bacterium]
MFSFDLTTLIGATYYGGNGDDFAPTLSVTADSVYIGGQTLSTNLPGTAGGAFPSFAGGTEPDAFVARLSLDLATVNRASYFGGTERDQADGVEVTPTAVYLSGYTHSVIPGTAGAAQASLAGSSDGFIARFSPDLTSLVRATYLGGTQGDGVSGDPSATADSLYVGGTTDSHDFPNTAGGLMPSLNALDSSHAGYVTRLSLDLTQNVQSTYYARDFGHISVFTVEAALGDVFIMGRGQGSGLPGTAGGAQPLHGGGFSDLFIARLSPALTSVVNATYFGGADSEEPGTNALLISGGRVFVGGHSTSATLPGIAGAAQETKGGPTDDYADAFIARFSADLTTLDQSTWFGGSAHESGSALTAGPSGIIYLAGGQPGSQLPGTSGAAIDSFAGGDGDGYIAAFTPDLAIIAPTPSVTISDFSAAEGNGGSTIFTFVVTLSEPASSNVSVQVQTVAGSATANSDFLPLLPFTLTFTPFGPTTREVTVQVTGDFTDEPNEQFTVTLSNPNGVTIADGTGVGTIVNDDAVAAVPAVPTLSMGALAALACALGLAAVFAMMRS